jgi:hypothetical protein
MGQKPSSIVYPREHWDVDPFGTLCKAFRANYREKQDIVIEIPSSQKERAEGSCNPNGFQFVMVFIDICQAGIGMDSNNKRTVLTIRRNENGVNVAQRFMDYLNSPLFGKEQQSRCEKFAKGMSTG